MWLDSDRNLLVVAILFLIVLVVVLAFLAAKVQGKTIHEMVRPDFYGVGFPEDFFPPDGEEYIGKRTRGYDLMAMKRARFLILVRNVGRCKAEMLFHRLEVLGGRWKDYSVHVYAEDSTDDTFYTIEKLARHNHRWYMLPAAVDISGMTRMQRMSSLRNFVVESLPEDTWDYNIWIDGDLAGPISLDGLASTISYIEEDGYVAMFGNGIYAGFLDSVHLPLLGWTYYDPLATVYLEHGIGNALGADKTIIARRGDPPIPVLSGFAGIGVYKAEEFRWCRYVPTENICEHVTLNRCIHERGGRMAVNPSLILLSGLQGGC